MTMYHHSNIVTELADWLKTKQGQQLLMEEIAEIEQILPQFRRDCVLNIGIYHHALCEIKKQAVCELFLSELVFPDESISNTVISSMQQLAVKTSSVDLLIGHHALDLVDQPMTTLAEIDRVLADDGQLIITGFNFQNSFLNKKMQLPSSLVLQSSLSMRGIKYWLNQRNYLIHNTYIVGASVEEDSPFFQAKYFFHRLCRALNLPLGPFYLIFAQKRVAKIRPKPLSFIRSTPLILSSDFAGSSMESSSILPHERLNL